MNANRNKKERMGGWAVLGCAAATMFVLAPSARADHSRFSFGISFGSRAELHPAYETVQRIEHVPAVYEDRERQVWHEPVFETREVVSTIPARVERVRVPRYLSCGTLAGYDLVLRTIEPERTVVRHEQVMVRPGYFETITERVLVRPATERIVEVRVPHGHREWVAENEPCGTGLPTLGPTRAIRTRFDDSRHLRVGFHSGGDRGFGFELGSAWNR